MMPAMVASTQVFGTDTRRMSQNMAPAKMPTCRPEMQRTWMVPVVKNASMRSLSSSSRRPSRTAEAKSA